MIIAGTLYDAGGTLPSIKLRFRAQQTTLNGVVQSTVKDFETQPDGTYSITLEPGYYSVYWVEKRSVVPLGTLIADETSEKTLPQALSSAGVPVTDESAEDFLSQLLAARDAAKQSEVNSKASEVESRAQADRSEQNADIASQRASEAELNAQSTAADRAAIEQGLADVVKKGEVGVELVTSPSSGERQPLNDVLASFASPVTSVGGKTGDVPYPTWDEVTDKPDFSSLYAPKHRGIVSPPVWAVSIGVSGLINLPNNTVVSINWDDVYLDTFSMHNGSNGFVIPAWATFARATLKMTIAPNSSGHRWAAVRLNGQDMHADRCLGIGPTWTNLNLHSVVFPTLPGDVIDLAVSQNSGTQLSIADNMLFQIELYSNN